MKNTTSSSDMQPLSSSEIAQVFGGALAAGSQTMQAQAARTQTMQVQVAKPRKGLAG